jgi:hypothetical protein
VAVCRRRLTTLGTHQRVVAQQNVIEEDCGKMRVAREVVNWRTASWSTIHTNSIIQALVSGLAQRPAVADRDCAGLMRFF